MVNVVVFYTDIEEKDSAEQMAEDIYISLHEAGEEVAVEAIFKVEE